MLITITNSGRPNGRPTTIGANTIDGVEHGGSYAFTLNDFTEETTPAYSDPEGDLIKYIQIQSIPSGSGVLELSGTAVSLNQLIYSGDISAGNLKYEASASVLESNQGVFKFDVADAGSSSLSGLNTGIMTVNVLEKENNPPDAVGDNSLTTENGETIVFTKNNFTSETNPSYSDPEGDDAFSLKILSLPSSGTLSLNNSLVTQGQEILFDQIALGMLTYVPAQNTSLHTLSFEFSISDEGSKQFTT